MHGDNDAARRAFPGLDLASLNRQLWLILRRNTTPIQERKNQSGLRGINWPCMSSLELVGARLQVLPRSTRRSPTALSIFEVVAAETTGRQTGTLSESSELAPQPDLRRDVCSKIPRGGSVAQAAFA